MVPNIGQGGKRYWWANEAGLQPRVFVGRVRRRVGVVRPAQGQRCAVGHVVGETQNRTRLLPGFCDTGQCLCYPVEEGVLRHCDRFGVGIAALALWLSSTSCPDALLAGSRSIGVEWSMGRLKEEKLHVCYQPGTGVDGPLTPRRYTLTHSDLTGDLYLTIGSDYDWKKLSTRYTRFMRDEVLAEWEIERHRPVLAVHCHVSGGVVFGPARLRDAIFRRELPLALEALCHGDRKLFEACPVLHAAPVLAHFHAKRRRYDVQELWGTPARYRYG